MPVLLGVLSAVFMAGAGFVCLHLLGLLRGPVGLGLAPAVGVACLAVLSTWGLQLGVPENIMGVLILGVSCAGLGLAARAWVIRGELRGCVMRPDVAMLLSALLIPIVVVAQAISIRAGVPDYIHDGATHAELVEALRHGIRVPGFEWYPAGFHAPAAAVLSLAPWIDSGSGAVGWAVGITLLAPQAMFGFASTLWRDPRIGAASALLLALTSTYPYEPHLYSTWPMAAGLLLMMGLWTAAQDYLTNPGPRLAVVGGLLAGALLLTHGTEIYTAVIGLAMLAAARWKVVASGRVVRHLIVAAVTAVLFAAPYLPQVGAWANKGGAVAVGADYYEVRHGGRPLDEPIQELLFWSSAVSSGLLVDLPFRLALLGIGGWFTFNNRAGRVVVALSLVFVGLVAMFRYVDLPAMRALFAVTLPWGVDGRLLMTVPLVAAPLAATGLVGLARALTRRARAAATPGYVRRVRWPRFARRMLVLGVALGLASVLLVAAKFSLQTGGVVTYSANDGAAMDWLRRNAQPGEVLMNDGSADAGIWATYKGNVAIVLPRTKAVAPDGPELLLRANIAGLDSRADVRAAACSLGVRYVFRGEGVSPSEFHRFPPLDELRRSSALEEIFSMGDAAIFRTRLNCPA